MKNYEMSQNVSDNEVVDDNVSGDVVSFPSKENVQKPELISQWAQFGLLVDWISDKSSSEVQALSDYIEENAVELVENFKEISAKASQQSQTVDNIVETSTNVLVEGRKMPLVEVVENLESLINVMINDVMDISKSAMNMVYIMEQAVQESQEVTAALEDIFQINKVTKYLSINALIEAARAGGDTGRSFGVVATGVRDLSHSTQQLAEKMNVIIGSLVGKLNESFELLEAIASKDLTEQIQMKEDISDTLQAMLDQAARQKIVLKDTVSGSSEISAAISKLVMAMQFQDYAKQRMQHLIEASNEMKNKADVLLKETERETKDGSIPATLSEEDVNELLERFSLSKFKGDFLDGFGGDSHMPRASDGESDGEVSGDDDGVDLF